MNNRKVLFFDIETAGVQGLKADRGFIVCFGYKWEGEKEPRVLTILDYPGKNIHDDSALMKEAWNVMEKADLLVAHYGVKFDIPYVRTRLAAAGLPPIPPTRNCDTCLLARTYYKLSSNRLGNLAEFFNLPEKKMDKRGGWPDWWMGALRGDKVSIRKMATYCAQDVRTLEAVFNKMRPIIPSRYLLNHVIGLDHYCCSACGGAVQFRGSYYSDKKLWRRFRCLKCHRWGREDKAIAKSFGGHQPARDNRVKFKAVRP